MGAPSLVLVAVWCPLVVVVAVDASPSSLWPCGVPRLSSWPWVPPRSSLWSCGAPLVVVVAMPPWSSSSPWVPLRSWVPSRCPCGCVVAPARPHGRVVPPCLSLWPCGGPPSFSRPWVLPCSSSWPCGASLVVVVAVGALDAVDAPPVVLVAVGTSLLVPVVVWCPLVAVIAVWCVPGGRRGCVRAWW